MPRSTGISGALFGLSTATLNTLKTDYTACLTAIAVAGQSYTIAGRQFNRANMSDVLATLAEIDAALERNAGTRTTQTFARFAD